MCSYIIVLKINVCLLWNKYNPKTTKQTLLSDLNLFKLKIQT